MGGGDIDDEFVAVATDRMDVLRLLDRPRKKSELVEELDRSRSTVDRALRELEPLELVTRGDGYRLTAAGRLVVEAFEGFADDLSSLDAARELLATLPRSAPVDRAMVRGARVERAEPPAPTEALEPVMEALRDAERLRGLSMGATRPERIARLVREQAEAGTAFELVFDEEMARYFRTDLREEMAPIFAVDNFEAWVHPRVPYGLVIVDGANGRRAFLVVYDDTHTLRGVLVNDAAAACEWAVDVFERYRAHAEPFSLD